MGKRTPSFTFDDALRSGWKGTKKNYPFFILLFAIQVGLLILRIYTSMNLAKHDPVLSMLLTLCFYIAYMILSVGTINAMLIITKGKRPVFSDLFTKADLVGNFIIASIIVSLIVIGGFILLIIPGIIWGLQLSFFSYALVDKRIGSWEALKKSRHITKGNLWRLFFFHIVLGLFNLLGAAFLLVGLFVTVPVTMIATAHVYRKLSKTA